MKQSIIHVALVVRDYDEAIEFYTRKLNFTLVEDTYQPAQDKRWVVVAPPGSNGTSLLLARASKAEQEAFIGNQAGGRVFLFLNTDELVGFWWNWFVTQRDSITIDFVRLIVSGDTDEVSRRLAATPALATAACKVGASRKDASTFFFPAIAHYLYAGDTALHMAAAAFRRPIAELLVKHGADCRARNRRGAEPLHYAADANHWDPSAQAETIEYLISAGADPNAVDRSGVAPLHRAVRTRSSAAVQALLNAGADPRLPNRTGSTPLHLARHNTGRSGSGSALAREQQTLIQALLRDAGSG